MKPNRWMYLSIAAVIVICAVQVYAGTGSISMTTYYPAPSGYYDNLTVTKSLRIPCYDSSNPIPANLPTNSFYLDHTDTIKYPTGCS